MPAEFAFGYAPIARTIAHCKKRGKILALQYHPKTKTYTKTVHIPNGEPAVTIETTEKLFDDTARAVLRDRHLEAYTKWVQNGRRSMAAIVVTITSG